MTGPANRTTNTDGGYSTYNWRGQQLLSVTSLRKVIGTPFNLVQWIVAQNIDAAIIAGNEGGYPFPEAEGPVNENEAADLLRWAPTIDLDVFKALKKDAAGSDKKKADSAKRKLTEYRRPIRAGADAERDVAADLGSRVHHAAEQRLTIAQADEDVRPFLRQFYAAERELDMETLLSEAQVFNLEAGYAGSLDLLARITIPAQLDRPAERIATVLDIKTGKDVFVDHLLQDLFYAYGEFIGKDDVVHEHATRLLHEAQGVGILHLRPDHWELIDLRPPTETRDILLGLARVANFYHSNPTIDPFVASRTRGEA